MPLPSKQKMIYDRLLEMFRKDTSEDGRLPSEPELAAQIGVARRTLRYTLAKLETEGFLIRTNHGTFLRKKYKQRETPITVLVPCIDYQASSGWWSSRLVYQMILGAVETAVRAGTYAVTLPITMNNDPTALDLSQFRHLNEESMVMTNSINWSAKLLPILMECGCRCGTICDKNVAEQISGDHGEALSCYYLAEYWECLGDAVRQLCRDGASRVVYLGCADKDISKYGRDSFIGACSEMNLEFSPEFYAVYERNMSYHQVLSVLRTLYRKTRFDGLIFDSNFYYELPGGADFFEESGIPRKTRMILGISELLQNPDLPPHVRVLYRPQKEISCKLAEFLLSGKKGVYSTRFKYEFPLLNEYFSRTGLQQ